MVVMHGSPISLKVANTVVNPEGHKDRVKAPYAIHKDSNRSPPGKKEKLGPTQICNWRPSRLVSMSVMADDAVMGTKNPRRRAFQKVVGSKKASCVERRQAIRWLRRKIAP